MLSSREAVGAHGSSGRGPLLPVASTSTMRRGGFVEGFRFPARAARSSTSNISCFGNSRTRLLSATNNEQLNCFRTRSGMERAYSIWTSE